MERGRKLAEAVDRVFAVINSASEATRSGAGKAQLAEEILNLTAANTYLG